jgi:PTH1 family peptidyl-tRNA hydrolase
MIAFVGLGNPGNEYADTKHNAGFWVVDELSRRWGCRFSPGIGDYVYAESKKFDSLLMKPTTGMNVSGGAVNHFVSEFGMSISDLHIVVDDVDLPLGTIRIRPKCGDGCHRGMESVIYSLGITNFPRLRIGVAASDQKRPAESYVLKAFRNKDLLDAAESVQIAADAAESIIRNGINNTMNHYNSKKKDEA